MMRMLRALGSTQKTVLMALGVGLLAIPAMGGKPGGGPQPVTESCTFIGDVEGGPVQIGVAAWTYELLDEGGAKTTLWLWDNVLQAQGGSAYEPPFEGQPLLPDDYPGQARVLKKQGRFDFDFDTEPCISPVYEDVPPFGIEDTPNADLCRYHLLIEQGDYNRKQDSVVWNPDVAVVYLLDYGLGPPCEVVGGEPCIQPGEYQVGSGPLLELSVQFHADGGGDDGDDGGSENGGQCKDGQDNDGDGLADCDDPDCAGTKWCS
jgi:hypothetical protein